uniref:Uncharacterized protein n=1 Tax=Rhizophora mucronata TaxID=61149 RepID=A0A2P2LE57_RHIMU
MHTNSCTGPRRHSDSSSATKFPVEIVNGIPHGKFLESQLPISQPAEVAVQKEIYT